MLIESFYKEEKAPVTPPSLRCLFEDCDSDVMEMSNYCGPHRAIRLSLDVLDVKDRLDRVAGFNDMVSKKILYFSRDDQYTKAMFNFVASFLFASIGWSFFLLQIIPASESGFRYGAPFAFFSSGICFVYLLLLRLEINFRKQNAD